MVYVPDKATPEETIAQVQRVFGAAGYMAHMSGGALVVDPVPAFLAREIEPALEEAKPEAMPANVQRIRAKKRA